MSEQEMMNDRVTSQHVGNEHAGNEQLAHEYVVTVTMENARDVLIEESFQRPVVVDFWADWCAPCKTLMPLLEKLAAEYAGQFLLAKVNCDEQQQIAGQFGVRSLPTVMVMRDGQPVDGFAGAQPESAIRQLLEKYLPKPWDILLQQAAQLQADGDNAGALPLLRRAVEESRQRPDIAIALAAALVQANRLDEAQEVLDKIKLAHRDKSWQQIVAQIELQREAAKTPEVRALETALATDPDNLDTAYQLALQHSQNQNYRDALELLIGVLRKQRDFKDGAAKRTLLDMLAVLGKGDPLAAEYQRKLFSLLY
jgi:putative thioredoxin